jgi:transcriptional regulator with XRE-family HTH domain
MKLASADTLRALMQQRDMSHARMARYAGCSKGMIDHLLAGRKKSVTPELAARIEEALDVPPGLIFGRSTA